VAILRMRVRCAVPDTFDRRSGAAICWSAVCPARGCRTARITVPPAKAGNGPDRGDL